LRIRLLGPPEVTVDGEPVRITGRPGVLLLTLAISAGRVVSLDRLVAAVWGEEPPENPRGSLRTVVKRVRGLIGAENVETHPAGYMLCAGPDEVDALRFLQLLDQAASTSDSASERRLLSEALGLWRGVPFEGVASAWLAESQAPWLIEWHLAATERRIDLEMAHGARDGLAAELRVLLARHPLRESLWVRLLTVLDLTGRRAEALEQYETIRRQIADELGVAPGPRLRAMHAKLIAADTAPQPPRGTAAGVSRPAEVEPVPAARVVPRQLPPDVAGFVGRE
jgi:DNA-binding SARP family transcriptional activator